MEIAERIICWIAAGFFVFLTFRLIKRNKSSWAISASLILAFVILLCSFTWFQGVFKTHIISVVYSTLKQYGEKLDDFQHTTARMQAELMDQQQNIAEQQKQLATAQLSLATAQSNIQNQQRQIESVEFLVNNLYSKTVYEVIRTSDTNHVFRRKLTNGDWQAFFILKHAAIERSLQGTLTWDGTGKLFPQMIAQPAPVTKNVLVQYFEKGCEFDQGELTVHYVNDTRETNLTRTIEFKGDDVFFDGTKVRFVQKPYDP